MTGVSLASDPWALPIGFIAIIIKVSAIERSYPGGRPQFERSYGVAFKNGAMTSLLVQSIADAERLLSRLYGDGLVPGQDIAVADMVHGPLLRCPGIAFEEVTDAFPPRWLAKPEGPGGAPGGPTAINGWPCPSDPNEGSVAATKGAPVQQDRRTDGALWKRVVPSSGGLVHYRYLGDDEDEE